MLRIVFRGHALTFNDLEDKLWKWPWVTAGSEWGWPNGREANSAVSSRVVWLSTDVFVWRTPIGSHYFGLYVVSRHERQTASYHAHDFLSNRLCMRIIVMPKYWLPVDVRQSKRYRRKTHMSTASERCCSGLALCTMEPFSPTSCTAVSSASYSLHSLDLCRRDKPCE